MNLKSRTEVMVYPIAEKEEPFKSRLREELIQLDEKVHALTDVCASPNSSIKVVVKEAKLLEEQLTAMKLYLDALIDRCYIHRICVKSITHNVGTCD